MKCQVLIQRLVGCALLGLLTVSASGFTLSDHAVKAFIRPAPVIATVEAEACSGLPVEAVEDDEAAGNGKAVRLTDSSRFLRTRQVLSRGTYALWCIGRVDNPPGDYREPMYVQFYVQGQGVSSQWRMRINYMTKYQDVAHLYFDVHEEGEYELSLCLGEGSHQSLVVDRLEVRDVLAGTWRKGFKTQSTVYTEPPYRNKRSQLPAFGREEALARARAIAGSLPPRNCILASGGMNKKGFYQELRLEAVKLAEPSADRWLWEMNRELEEPWSLTGPTLPIRDELTDALEEGDDGGAMAVSQATARSFGATPEDKPDFNWGDAELGDDATYTVADYHAFRLAPGRWPDDGGGYFIPKSLGNTAHHRYFNWMAGAFKQRITTFRGRLVELAESFYQTGDPQVGFRAALMVAFYADHFPSLDHTVQGTLNTTWGTYPFNTFSGRHAGSFGKIDYSGWAGANNLPVVLAYDKIFPVIADNQLLADAIGQVIPWVKTPADVVTLIDVKLVQHFFDVADRGLVRFGPGVRCHPLVAMVQGNNEAGRAMMRRIVHDSNLQHAALLDALVCRRSRDSTSFIGSMFYAKAPSLDAGNAVAVITAFGRRNGFPELILDDPVKSKVLGQSARWLYEPYAAGMYVPGVGDVAGHHGVCYMTVGDVESPRTVLWHAYKSNDDPRFAWLLEHVYGVGSLPVDRERLQAAAATVTRDPRSAMPSRILGGFGVAILEAHRQHHDYRRRSGLVMRTGSGSGHAHQDQLNLELFSKGLVMMPEFGGRPGYGTPQTTAPESHCLVTVDGNVDRHGQTAMLVDVPGFAAAEGRSKRVTRLASLVEVGEDDAYVFDWVAARGGSKRTYWFHGNETETVDARAVEDMAARTISAPEEGDDVLDDLDDMVVEAEAPPGFRWSDSIFSHNVPAGETAVTTSRYEAVWPLQKELEAQTIGRINSNHRFTKAGSQYRPTVDPKAPRKYTRLLLLNSKDRHAETLTAVSKQVGYRITCAGIGEERPTDVESTFAAIIEPFAGKPFVLDAKTLPVATGTAAEVHLAGDRIDRHYVGQHGQRQSVDDGNWHVDTQYGFLSTQGDGTVRQASMIGGNELRAAGIWLRATRPEYLCTIDKVDHVNQRITTDRLLPNQLLRDAEVFIGPSGEPFHIDSVETVGASSVLTFAKTAEIYRSPVFLVHDRTVVGPIEPEHPFKSGWLTNEAGDRGWPVSTIEIGRYRWMGTGFRGGVDAGCPLSWDDIPDSDNDGKRTLLLGPNEQWEEPMRVEVLTVDSKMRSFCFYRLNTPKGYAGTRSFAGGPIRNEDGRMLTTAVMPGKMGSFVLSPKAEMAKQDFADSNGDGVAKFHVYCFGPGHKLSTQTYVSVQRQGAEWLVSTNVSCQVGLPGKAIDAWQDGKWKALPSAVEAGLVVAELDEKILGDGELRLRTR